MSTKERLLRFASHLLRESSGGGQRCRGPQEAVLASGAGHRDDLVEPYRINLEHQIRLWDAEEENSRRIAGRVGLLITASFGFFGLVLLRFALATFSVPSVSGSAVNFLYAAVVALVVGLVCLFLACLYLFDVVRPLAARLGGRPHEGGPPASELLQLEAEVFQGFQDRLDFLLGDEGEVPEGTARRLVCEQLLHQTNQYYYASESLRSRNAEEKQRVDSAQGWFLSGITGIMLALVLWVCASVLGTPQFLPPSEESSDVRSTAAVEHVPGEAHREEAEGVGPDEPGGAPSPDAADGDRDAGADEAEHRARPPSAGAQ